MYLVIFCLLFKKANHCGLTVNYSSFYWLRICVFLFWSARTGTLFHQWLYAVNLQFISLSSIICIIYIPFSNSSCLQCKSNKAIVKCVLAPHFVPHYLIMNYWVLYYTLVRGIDTNLHSFACNNNKTTVDQLLHKPKLNFTSSAGH